MIQVEVTAKKKTPHPNPLPTTEAAVPEPGRGDKKKTPETRGPRPP